MVVEVDPCAVDTCDERASEAWLNGTHKCVREAARCMQTMDSYDGVCRLAMPHDPCIPKRHDHLCAIPQYHAGGPALNALPNWASHASPTTTLHTCRSVAIGTLPTCCDAKGQGGGGHGGGGGLGGSGSNTPDQKTEAHMPLPSTRCCEDKMTQDMYACYMWIWPMVSSRGGVCCVGMPDVAWMFVHAVKEVKEPHCMAGACKHAAVSMQEGSIIHNCV